MIVCDAAAAGRGATTARPMMTTAQITLETGLGLKHRNVAGIVFQNVATADFKEMVQDTEELLRSAAADTGTTVETSSDEYGYRWIVLRDDDFEDLVVAINTVSSSLETAGYGDRVLLRLANLGYQQHAMQLPGIAMRVVGEDATLLRSPAGVDTSYATDTLYIGPGDAGYCG